MGVRPKARKSVGYWIIITLMFLLIAVVVFATIGALIDGYTLDFVLGAILSVYLVLSADPQNLSRRLGTWTRRNKRR